MPATLNALHREHEELLPHVEQFKSAAETIGLAPVEAVINQLEEAYAFLTQHLIPHARAEEDVLYRAYDQVANSPWATDTMRRDHEAIVAMGEELIRQRLLLSTDPLTVEQEQELRRILYGLYALVKQHFSQEEAIIVPRLEDSLTQEAADEMIHRMEEAAQRHHASI